MRSKDLKFRIFQIREKKGGVFVARVDKGIVGEGVNHCQGFLEILRAGIGKVCATDAIGENGIAYEDCGRIMSNLYRFRVGARNDKKRRRTWSVTGNGDDLEGVIA